MSDTDERERQGFEEALRKEVRRFEHDLRKLAQSPTHRERAALSASERDALEAIADAAWRAREVLHLNLMEIGEGLHGPAAKNLTDAINDLNAHLPLCEDGRWWRA